MSRVLSDGVSPPPPMEAASMGDLTARQIRMLKSGTFHFDSGGDNKGNLKDASDLLRRGLLRIRQNVYSQHSVFQCEVTAAGRKAIPR